MLTATSEAASYSIMDTNSTILPMEERRTVLPGKSSSFNNVWTDIAIKGQFQKKVFVPSALLHQLFRD